ncbi:hypothetical protein [Streptosporangium sp. NPDC087985]|uniref:hypothetical protein n=1 Tax=Streptosporangium sp. NPDC087985 TaxID=3366196 RepID=UPI0037FE1E54
MRHNDPFALAGDTLRCPGKQQRHDGRVRHRTTHLRRIRDGFPPGYGVAFRSALALQDLHRLERV